MGALGLATAGTRRYERHRPETTLLLALTAQGQVRCTLKTPYRDGTTHVIFEPLDFMARLAALVPPPRVHLTRYHGVFAPNSRLRAEVTPAGPPGQGELALE
jgi:Putative transposase